MTDRKRPVLIVAVLAAAAGCPMDPVAHDTVDVVISKSSSDLDYSRARIDEVWLMLDDLALDPAVREDSETWDRTPSTLHRGPTSWEDLPLRVTVERETYARVLELQGCVPLEAWGMYGGLPVAFESVGGTCLDFHSAEVSTSLSASPGIDLLRGCAEDDDCSAGLCADGPGAGGFCSASCEGDADCPRGARCTSKLGGTSVCITRCDQGLGCPDDTFIRWQCDVDDDGLCGLAD